MSHGIMICQIGVVYVSLEDREIFLKFLKEEKKLHFNEHYLKV